jgi:pyruvate/2-oxoglutarate dehydrogenase complex dihydrolipoamide acyltransferase (E2) component
LTRRKRLTWIIVAGVLVSGAGATVARNRNQATPVLTAQVATQDIVSKVTANGKIQAENKVEMSALVQGQVVNLAVHEGDKVKRGDFLLQIDRNRAAAEEAGSSAALKGMAKVPAYVRAFVKAVPSIWQDTRFVNGYPGQFVVLARQGEGRWYVAGINGSAEARAVSLDLGGLPVRGTGTLITDGDGGNLSFRQETVRLDAGKRIAVTIKARGGFVMVLEQEPPSAHERPASH